MLDNVWIPVGTEQEKPVRVAGIGEGPVGAALHPHLFPEIARRKEMAQDRDGTVQGVIVGKPGNGTGNVADRCAGKKRLSTDVFRAAVRAQPAAKRSCRAGSAGGRAAQPAAIASTARAICSKESLPAVALAIRRGLARRVAPYFLQPLRDPGQLVIHSIHQLLQEKELRDSAPLFFPRNGRREHAGRPKHRELVTAGHKGRFHVVAELDQDVPKPLEVAEIGCREQPGHQICCFGKILAQTAEAEERVLAECPALARRFPRRPGRRRTPRSAERAPGLPGHSSGRGDRFRTLSCRTTEA